MAITVSIPSYKLGKPVLYEITVNLGEKTTPYTIKKRYNDFLRLATDVETEIGEPVLVAPPPKPRLWQSVDYEQRRADLEIMLTALVRIPEFAQSLALNNFLETYTHRHSANPATHTLDWVHTTTEISKLIGEARTLVKTPHIRQRTLQAKALVGQLQRSLSNNAEKQLGTGERARRQQQLDNYLMSVRQLESRNDVSAFQSSDVYNLGSGMPRSGPASDSSSGFPSTRGDSRVLGETSETRKQNNQGLLQSQKASMDSQDEIVDGLRAAISRQRELGLAIHEEVLKQNELLDDLDTDVHRVNSRLNEARRKTEKLNR